MHQERQRAGRPDKEIYFARPVSGIILYLAYCQMAAFVFSIPIFSGTNALSVTGTVSMPGYTYCSGMVNSSGIKQTSTGQVTYTSGQVSTGTYSITFAAAHPIGNTYITNITGKGVLKGSKGGLAREY